MIAKMYLKKAVNAVNIQSLEQQSHPFDPFVLLVSRLSPFPDWLFSLTSSEFLPCTSLNIGLATGMD